MISFTTFHPTFYDCNYYLKFPSSVIIHLFYLFGYFLSMAFVQQKLSMMMQSVVHLCACCNDDEICFQSSLGILLGTSFSILLLGMSLGVSLGLRLGFLQFCLKLQLTIKAKIINIYPSRFCCSYTMSSFYCREKRHMVVDCWLLLLLFFFLLLLLIFVVAKNQRQ